jgi:DNA-binding NarL/FixJ family response regulator
MTQKSRKILLVDDDILFVSLMSDFLSDAGFDITTAADGEEGLQLVKHQTFDLIIADIMMPRMDGFEMVEQIQQDPRSAHIPVVMLSAKGETSDRIHGLRAGANAFMVKPFELEELTAQLEALLRYHQSHGEPKNGMSSTPTTIKSAVGYDSLTPSEKAVLNFVAMGLLNKEIAKKLNVSTRTIESHVRSMLQKTTLDNRTALARWAMDGQLV